MHHRETGGEERWIYADQRRRLVRLQQVFTLQCLHHPPLKGKIRRDAHNVRKRMAFDTEILQAHRHNQNDRKRRKQQRPWEVEIRLRDSEKRGLHFLQPHSA